jgi:hypothetical protein
MMPRRYSFDYTALTIGDARDIMNASATSNVVLFLSVIARCHKEDVYTIPMSEMRNLIQQFQEGLVAYMKSLEDADVSDAMRLLKSMFGEGQSNA